MKRFVKFASEKNTCIKARRRGKPPPPPPQTLKRPQTARRPPKKKQKGHTDATLVLEMHSIEAELRYQNFYLIP